MSLPGTLKTSLCAQAVAIPGHRLPRQGHTDATAPGSIFPDSLLIHDGVDGLQHRLDHSPTKALLGEPIDDHPTEIEGRRVWIGLEVSA
jgi:hypothetical protein